MMKMVNVYLCMHIPDATYGMVTKKYQPPFPRMFHRGHFVHLITGEQKSIHGASGYVYVIFIIYTWNLEMSSILRVVCPPKQGLIFQPKQGSSFGFQDIYIPTN